MRLQRDLSGDDLAVALRKLGYDATRQTGNHLRLSTHEGGEHHVTVPRASSPQDWNSERDPAGGGQAC